MRAFVADLQESGSRAIDDNDQSRLAIRAAIVNHRTRPSRHRCLVEATLAFGRAGVKSRAA